MNDLILIVDDERDLVEALEYALQREGFRTSVAIMGQQALALAASPCPDLILLDLMLPDMAGTQVCLQLRAGPATRVVPIVMMTAKAAEILTRRDLGDRQGLPLHEHCSQQRSGASG